MTADGRFTSFILLAEMRTGSNFLEDNLNRLADVRCHGEAFNPSFIGHARQTTYLGIDMAAREADPLGLLAAIRASAPGVLHGFRFFHDHDPRVLEACLPDPACAKVILQRNPLESYVSRKIAQETGQWKLTNAKHSRQARVRFDADEFAGLLERLQGFQLRVQHALQVSGQGAFYINYEDIADLNILNGLATFLGSARRLEEVAQNLKKQNPGDIEEKVTNPVEMARALGRIDPFALGRSPDFEPRRGPVVPSYVAGAAAPILLMPVRSGPDAALRAWVEAHDRALGATGPLVEGFTQKSLRQWKRKRPGFAALSVLRHPLARAHHAFCTHILPEGPGAYLEIRAALRRHHAVNVPQGASAPWYDIAAHRAAFLAFLGFLKLNLAGQTSLRVDPTWCSQSAVLAGHAQLSPPTRVIREADLAHELAQVEQSLGLAPQPIAQEPEPGPYPLAEVVTDEVQEACRAVYGRDYVNFGFSPWKPGA